MTYSGSATRIRHSSPTETSEWSAASHTPIAAIKHRRDLENHVHFIAASLGSESTPTDLHQTRVILDQIADLVRNDGRDIRTGDYARLLEDLDSIYSGGGMRRGYSSFSATASGYARVIKALSRRCPSCNYRKSIGQLLDLMTILFEARDPSWKSLFRLLRAMPKSVKGREQLQRVCSMYVPEWFEAGVPNLYSQQKELRRDIDRLDLEIEALESEIRAAREELETIEASTRGLADPKIAILAAKRIERNILRCRRNIRKSLDERGVKKRAVDLVASDIRDLGNRFRSAGRAYRLQLV